MQKQIVSGSYSMNIRNRRILRARIRRHHDVAIFVGENDLPCDIALHNFVIEVPPHRVATNSVKFKALLQCQSAGFESDIHESRA
jgi:hypothetical protein